MHSSDVRFPIKGVNKMEDENRIIKLEGLLVDQRYPRLEKIGCFYSVSDKKGFNFFDKDTTIKDNDVFIYNKGILWRLEK